MVGSLDGSGLGLLLGDALGNEDVVFGLLLLLRDKLALLEGILVAAALEAEGGDESLDFGCLGVGLSVLLLLAGNLPTNDVFPHVVLLAEVEEAPDLGSTLRTQSLGENDIGQSRDLALALLDDDQGEDGDVRANDATADGFALALATSAGSVARVAVGEEEANTVGKENTLLHRETLLVVSTSDSENVSLPLIAQRIGGDFLRHLLVVKDANLLLIVDIEKFLGPSGGVGDIELHS